MSIKRAWADENARRTQRTESLRIKGGVLSRRNEGWQQAVMRNGQNKRMRGRNRKSQNPMTRVFESNGPDVKIRGNPSHIAEKYLQLARDAQTSGDPVAAENYYQHAEHYFRLIAAAQEQFRQNNPQFYRAENEQRDMRDDGYDDGGDEMPPAQGMPGPGEVPFGPGEPQPYLPREAQPYQGRDQQQPYPPREHQPREHQPREHREHQSREHQGRDHQNYAPRSQPAVDGSGDIDRLPSFITGGQPQQGQGGQNHQGHGQNGHESQGDRFPLHRRRRRHRGPRPEVQGAAHGGDGDDTHGE
jgi:hypothetical protein